MMLEVIRWDLCLIVENKGKIVLIYFFFGYKYVLKEVLVVFVVLVFIKDIKVVKEVKVLDDFYMMFVNDFL